MGKINSKRIFYFCYTLFLITLMFSNVNFLHDLIKYNNYIIYFCLISCILLQIKTYKKSELIFMTFCFITVVISWIISQNNSLLILFLFIFSMKNIEFDTVVKYDLKLKTIFVCLVVILYYLDLTNNFIMYRNDGTIRSSMGFSHPNTFGSYIFSIFCEIIYLNRNKKKFILITILTVISYSLVNYFSDSRGSSYAIIILYLFIFVKKIDFIGIMKNKFIKYIFITSIFSLTMFSYFISINYDKSNKTIYEINSVFSGRISSTKKFIDEYNTNLLGNELHIVTTKQSILTGESPIILDNAYIKLILQFGLIAYFIFSICFTLSIKQAFYKNNYILVIIFLTYAFRGLTGNILFYLYGNIFLLYFSDILYKKQINSEVLANAKN